MSEQLKQRQRDGSMALLGVFLIGLGILFVVGRWLQIDVGRWAWPFFVLLPGLALIALGLAARGQSSQGLVVVGTVVTAVGALLFYHNVSGHWASWSYAWALIAPTAVGVGQIIYGTAKGHPEVVNAGTRLAGIGVVIFLVMMFFFELVIGIGGFGLGSWSWSLLLIGIGFVLVLRSLLSGSPKNS